MNDSCRAPVPRKRCPAVALVGLLTPERAARPSHRPRQVKPEDDNGSTRMGRLVPLGYSGGDRPGFAPEFPVRRPSQAGKADHQRSFGCNVTGRQGNTSPGAGFSERNSKG